MPASVGFFIPVSQDESNLKKNYGFFGSYFAAALRDKNDLKNPWRFFGSYFAFFCFFRGNQYTYI